MHGEVRPKDALELDDSAGSVPVAMRSSFPRRAAIDRGPNAVTAEPDDTAETVRDAILVRGLIDSGRMVRAGSLTASVSVPLIFGWVAFVAGAETSLIWCWAAAVVFAALSTVALCSAALQSQPWTEPGVWLRRMNAALFVIGLTTSSGLLLVHPRKDGQIDPLWTVSLMVFSGMLAANTLVGFGIRSMFPTFCTPVTVVTILSCLRVGGWLGALLALGVVVFVLVVLGTNWLAGSSFRRATELRVRNDRLVRDLEAANELLERRAHSDALTGLANRAGLWSELERREANPADSTVLFIDLDGFKPINDEFGHNAGDEVLRVVADRLGRIVRAGDIVARMGGDEFVVVAHGFEDADSGSFGERVRSVIEEPMHLHGQMLRISAAIGVATHRPEQPMQATLAEADARMYAMKRARRPSA